MRKRTRKDDPTVYRIEYSRIAQLLHIHTRGVEASAMQRKERLSDAAETAIASSLGELTPAQLERGTDLRRATPDAMKLIEDATAQLQRLGHRWVGRRPPWYVYWLRRRRSRGDRKLAEFLDRVLEPAAVILYFSCALESGGELRVPPTAPRLGRLFDRSKAIEMHEKDRRELSQRWLRAYLSFLRAGTRPKGKRWQRLLGWLGFTWLREEDEPNYRVRYNLACLFSRLALRESDRDVALARAYLEEAFAQLTQCLSALSGRRREAVVVWARNDPGLTGLQLLDGPTFREITGLRD